MEKELEFNAVVERTIKVTETEEAFIFEYMSKYINGAITLDEGGYVIPKRLLTRALECFKQEHKEEWDIIMKSERKE